ncbi:MAG: hydrogenase formation protein HypD [Chloroflexi bacterium]|nr:hydrogenase formation protein HypD [Chloroflexota bacterium]
MSDSSPYRDPAAAQYLIGEINAMASRPVRIIEFCGGHTHAIMRYGLRRALAPAVKLLSGPGCPVCVTADHDIDAAIWLSQQPGVILATFGDMLHVPGMHSSLQRERARGARVEVVYSALDALALARKTPDQHVVMLGIGFETTAPTIAAAIKQAAREALDNFSVYSVHKLTPPAMRAILSGELLIDAVLAPGHLSAIIGADAWQFIPDEYGIPCATAGFEPLDILLALHSLVRAVIEGRPQVLNTYRRGVAQHGNQMAQELLSQVLLPADADWRGLEMMPSSGLELAPEYAHYNTRCRFELPELASTDASKRGCRCGEVLAAIIEPTECPLFGCACTPAHPVGPCMISAEGTCSAFFRYGREEI